MEGAEMNTQEEQWLTGFWEGDGSAFISARGQLTVNFSQMERTILEYVDSLTEGGRFNTGAHNISMLQFHGLKCIPLLAIFARHVVSKHSIERLAKLSGALEALVPRVPTTDWLIGFFDAEGWPGRQPSLAIEQKERDVLDKIVASFGGSVHLYHQGTSYRWFLGGNEARELAHKIAGRSHNSLKAKRVLDYFSGPTYQQLHKGAHQEAVRRYREKHSEQLSARRKERSIETREYNKKYWTEHKLVAAYIKEHPEITVGLGCEA